MTQGCGARGATSPRPAPFADTTTAGRAGTASPSRRTAWCGGTAWTNLRPAKTVLDLPALVGLLCSHQPGGTAPPPQVREPAMSTFSIITSRGTQTDITTDDRAADMDAALRVAEALHRTITLDDLQFDGVLRGTYRHNGRTERIVIVGTGLDGAKATDAMRAVIWVGEINE
ncbi:hypothetical protein Nigel_82 [Mycobacterium phage Nigel]|uniref:Uncharacterized protein n=1 Tax=Mycobacterium phage Nigel TaxID=543152 RepID=B3VM11_9CAUD|nr:gp82 [Mycobacterium phage Nigel]ACF05085.1 hypothetical protein Nigel_82 [Mycobacterium phage Nigel]